MPKPQLVIWTHPWIEFGGGDIDLHSFCDRLNALCASTFDVDHLMLK